MKTCLLPLIAACMTFGLAHAEGLTVNNSQRAFERCAAGVADMRGVWRSPLVFLPIYADWPLVSYLAPLGHDRGLTVLPVLASEPFAFRSRQVVFLSTALILQANGDAELGEAIRGARMEARSAELPACMAMRSWTSATLTEIQRRLSEQIATYNDVTMRRLRIRKEAAR